MTAAQAWAAMGLDPLAFLGNNALTITSTGSNRPSGLNVLRLEKQMVPLMDGTTTPHFNVQQTPTGAVYRQRWQISRVNQDPAAYALPADQPTVVERLAYYIVMVDRDESAADTHFALPSAGGPNLVFTCQLTGCTFARGHQPLGGPCFVCHIASRGEGGRAAVSHTALARMPAPPGAGAGGGPSPVSARGVLLNPDAGYSRAEGATVMGRRTPAGVWEFFCQRGGRGGSAVVGSAQL